MIRQLAAFLGDSFREAMDRRTLLILAVLAAFMILFCFGISFEAESPEKVLAAQAENLGDFRGRSPGPFGGALSGIFKPRCTVGDIRTIEDGGWPEALRGGYSVNIDFADAGQIDALCRTWKSLEARLRGGRPRAQAEVEGPLDPATRRQFLQERFQHLGYNHVEVLEVRADPPSYSVGVRSDYPQEVSGAHHISIGFGLARVPLTEVSVAEAIVAIQIGLANVFAGFIGMLIAISVSASYVPNMLQKGTIDLLLARPLGRARLLCLKYLGAVGFVFILAAFLIGGCWLGLSLRTQYFSPWFLCTVVTVTAMFAVLHSVAVLVGVVTRSGGLSALAAIGLWAVSSAVVGIRQGLKTMFRGEEVPASLQTALDVAYYILPKTRDLGSLNGVFLSRSHLSPQAAERVLPDEFLQVDWTFSICTTALFTVVMLALASAYFRRRDY